MKFTTSSPVTIGTVAYSTLEMVRYVVDTDRRYNTSAEAARAGVRTVKAFEAGQIVDLAEEDLRLIAAVLERPMRGWGSFKTTREVPQQQRNGTIKNVEMTTLANVPAREFLPLIDPIASAAAKLPPLTTP